MTAKDTGNLSTSPHMASFLELGSKIIELDNAPEVQDAFSQDAISNKFSDFRTAISAFLLNVVEGFISKTDINFRDVEDIYTALHEETWGSLSSPTIQRLDLKALTDKNFNKPPPNRGFYEFLERHPNLSSQTDCLRKSIFSFLNEMSTLAYGKENNLGSIPTTFNANSNDSQQSCIPVETIIDGHTYDGFAIVDTDGEVGQCIFPRIESFIQAIPAP